MDLEFVGKRIEGVLTILPENEYIFEDEVLNPQDAKAKRLKRIIGFGKRRRNQQGLEVDRLQHR